MWLELESRNKIQTCQQVSFSIFHSYCFVHPAVILVIFVLLTHSLSNEFSIVKEMNTRIKFSTCIDHFTHKRQRIPKGQSTMDNQEKLTTYMQGTQNQEIQKTRNSAVIALHRIFWQLCKFVWFLTEILQTNH